MAGYISEFFGYHAEDQSKNASLAVAKLRCPVLGTTCSKTLSDGTISGVCAIKQKTSNKSVICCPIRMYADDYRMLREISQKAFNCNLNLYAGRMAIVKAREENGAIAVFGHGWGGELRLPQRQGTGNYFVDWVLVRLDGDGKVAEFTAIEVQTIDTTGNYRSARSALLNEQRVIPDTVGLNWENVAKRIIPQIIFKGQVLQREDLCNTGLFFICPTPVYDRVINRLGGYEKIPRFPRQKASINFIAYDYTDTTYEEGVMQPLCITAEHSTTVYKVQEAFSSLNLPKENVYRDAIYKSLYDDYSYETVLSFDMERQKIKAAEPAIEFES